MNGILNVNKPAGWTSHDVVAWLRRLLHVKRVGHAGTLDPLATGVLLVCVGQATRVAEYLMAGPKSYQGTIQLGVVTDTYDVEGTILARHPVPDLTRAALQDVLARFVGRILQTPPVFSAIKQDGVSLHRLARRGQAVAPAPRPVTIHRIALLSWEPPFLEVAVDCNPGTYIRSLAHDVGQALGCGAALAGLIRTRSGAFTLAEAATLEELAAAAAAGTIGHHLRPLRAALSGLIPVTVTEAQAATLRRGQPIPEPLPGGDLDRQAADAAGTAGAAAHPPAPLQPRRGYGLLADGTVVAILRYDPAGRAWWPDKVFAADD